MSNLLKNYYNNKKIKTILGKKTKFVGNLNFEESIKINGNFSGVINASGLLIIGEDAYIEADVVAQSVIVCGTIKGDIHANERVEMLPTGRVYGNVKAKKIKISDGVIFYGECKTIK
ncbi:MAG: polymer-forming cytoskeletal protein [Spirochaetes bacterium]|nr:polymer-forming cytoskeletal protein [Spirochaetota bacterium]